MRDPYDRLLQGMLPFHNHFRESHAQLMRVVPTSQAAPRRTLEAIVQKSLSLTRSLEMHHNIEETYIFPILATKMPSFGTKDPVHINEHKAMHEKLEIMEQYTTQTARKLQSAEAGRLQREGCGEEVVHTDGEQEDQQVKAWPTSFYDAAKFETILRDLAQTLFPHLDAEEKSLRAENLKKHGLTVQEVARVPM